jgi:hypothetical protein
LTVSDAEKLDGILSKMPKIFRHKLKCANAAN